MSLPFQSALNVFYMVMAVYGYWQWHHKARDNNQVVSWPFWLHALLVMVLAGVVVLLGKLAASQFNHEHLWLDAAVNVFSVVTTFMVAHKVLQNWVYQGNRILLPKNKLCSEFIGPASHFEFASHAGFVGV